MSRLLMGLATASLSAWVTLAVIQVALRTEHFEIHSVYIYSEIGRAICSNCMEICRIPSDPPIEYYPWISRLYGGEIGDLDPKIPKVMSCVAAKLSKFGYRTSNDVQGYKPMTAEEQEAICYACRNTYNWWINLEPKLATAQSYTYNRDMKKEFLSYKRFMDIQTSQIDFISQHDYRKYGNRELFILIKIIRLNQSLYEDLVTEVGPKHHKPYDGDAYARNDDDEEECKSYPGQT